MVAVENHGMMVLKDELKEKRYGMEYEARGVGRPQFFGLENFPNRGCPLPKISNCSISNLNTDYSEFE